MNNNNRNSNASDETSIIAIEEASTVMISAGYQAVKKKFKKAVTINRSRYEVDKHNLLLIPRIDMGKKISLFKIFLKMETFYEDIKYKQNELYL